MSANALGKLDQAKLERLYVRLEKPMYNVVYRWLWDAEEAQDVVQEAFVRVWKARERVEAATVEALLYRTALNLASNRRRARKLWRWVSLEALRQHSDDDEPALQAASAEQQLYRRQRQRLVKEAVEALPEALRQVVMLCEYSELSHQQIADMLGIPVGTVGSRRHRALRQLRERLGAAGGNQDDD